MAQKICEFISTYMKENQDAAYHISSFSNGRSLLESSCDFDVIFLDIQMEQPDGMETAKMLRQRNIHCLVVFITVLKEYVFDAFEVQAYDYLVKPIIFPHFVGMPLLYLLLAFATVAAFAICICFYAAVLSLLSLKENDQTPYIGLLLLPGLFFFLAELYILHMSYSQVSSTLSLTEMGKHMGLLFIQGLGLAALLCTLYAYRRICSGFQAQSVLSSLAQAAQAQKIYISEAQIRYEQTKAFRHDIKNHLLLLDGLLSNGQIAERRDYLKRLESISTSLSFPYQTGNPVVDILLSEKLELAKANGIKTDVSLLLPKTCSIDDLDLCIIFANALDNALKACQSITGTRSISITGKQQGDFY